MITTTLGTLVEAEPALRRVCALPLHSTANGDGLSQKTKYQLAKMARTISVETKHYADERDALLARLKIVQGQPIDPATLAEYQRAMHELLTISVTLDSEPVRSSDIVLALASDLVELGVLCELVPLEQG